MLEPENTAVQAAFNAFQDEATGIYSSLVADLESQGITAKNYSKRVDDSFRNVEYETTMEKAFGNSSTVAAVGATNATMITINPVDTKKYFLFTQFKGRSLSDTIHSKESQKVVKETLDEFFTTRRSVEGLFQSVKANGFKPVAELPKKLDDLIQTVQQSGTDEDLLKALNQAKSYVASVGQGAETSGQQLRRAYEGVITAAESGQQEALNKAIDQAVNKKVDSLNKRIARTETARAYDMSFSRAVLEDPRITAMMIVLSSGHPEADICDCYAEADLYGMGPGVVPLDAGINIPFHPNCLCGKLPVIGVVGEASGKFSQKRLGNYLSNRNEQDRKRIVGAKYAGSKTDYKAGLQNKGFTVTKKPAMIPKSLINSTTTKEE